MNAHLRVLGLLFAFVLASARARAAEPPVHLRLTAHRTTYYLVDGGKSLRKKLEGFRRAEATGSSAPPGSVDHGDRDLRGNLRRQLERPIHRFEPLAVNLTLEISNVTNRDVSFLSYGDDGAEVRFELKGPGVVVLTPRRLRTLEFRAPQPTELAPGHTQRINLTRLAYGERGEQEQAYWTVPGRYTLTAFFKTAIKPVAAGRSADRDRFEPVTLTSNPLTINVRSGPVVDRSP